MIADSTLRSSRAVPHPSTNRALRRLTSEVRRDPVYSTWYGRQRRYMLAVAPRQQPARFGSRSSCSGSCRGSRCSNGGRGSCGAVATVGKQWEGAGKRPGRRARAIPARLQIHRELVPDFMSHFGSRHKLSRCVLAGLFCAAWLRRWRAGARCARRLQKPLQIKRKSMTSSTNNKYLAHSSGIGRAKGGKWFLPLPITQESFPPLQQLRA